MTGPHGYAEHFRAPEGYLDFAGFGPPGRDVLDACAKALGEAAAGTGGGTPAAGAAGARAALARLTGGDAERVVLLPDTSTGLFHAALGVPSGTVLVAAREPARGPRSDIEDTTGPVWRRAAALGRAAPRPLDGPASPDAVRAALTGDVVAVAVSAVDPCTGYRADLGALREVVGDRLLVVDAQQGLGAARMDWHAADVVAGSGSTWLRAGWGTGFAVLSGRALERLRPAGGGGSGAGDQASAEGTVPAEGVAGFAAEPGPVAAAALTAAIGLVERVGLKAVERHIGERVEQLVDTVRAAGGRVLSPVAHQERAGIVAFTVPGADPRRISGTLARHGVTAAVVGGSVRLSPHASTPLAAVDRVLAALGEVRRR